VAREAVAAKTPEQDAAATFSLDEATQRRYVLVSLCSDDAFATRFEPLTIEEIRCNTTSLQVAEKSPAHDARAAASIAVVPAMAEECRVGPRHHKGRWSSWIMIRSSSMLIRQRGLRAAHRPGLKRLASNSERARRIGAPSESLTGDRDRKARCLSHQPRQRAISSSSMAATGCQAQPRTAVPAEMFVMLGALCRWTSIR